MASDTFDMFIEATALPKHHTLSLVGRGESNVPTITSEAWTFSLFTTAILELANELPNRVTIRQLLAFAMILEEVSLGRSTTIKGLRTKAGNDKRGAEVLGQSIGRTYQIFLAPTRKEPDGLGWLYVEENESDRREKFLRLTKEGEAVALKLARILKEKP